MVRMRKRGPFRFGCYVWGLACLAVSAILLGSLAFLARYNGQDTGSASSLARPTGTTVRFAHTGDSGSGSSSESPVANRAKGWNPHFALTADTHKQPTAEASPTHQNT